MPYVTKTLNMLLLFKTSTFNSRIETLNQENTKKFLKPNSKELLNNR